MRIFQYRSFKNWAMDEGFTDSDLLSIIEEMEKGLIVLRYRRGASNDKQDTKNNT
jgi:hypothetical protein